MSSCRVVFCISQLVCCIWQYIVWCLIMFQVVGRKTRVCLSKQLPLIILSMKTKSTRVWSLFKETAALEYLEYEETLQWDFMNYSVLREKIQQQGRKLKNFLCIWCKFTTTWACYQNRMIVMIHRIDLLRKFYLLIFFLVADKPTSWQWADSLFLPKISHFWSNENQIFLVFFKTFLTFWLGALVKLHFRLVDWPSITWLGNSKPENKTFRVAQMFLQNSSCSNVKCQCLWVKSLRQHYESEYHL